MKATHFLATLLLAGAATAATAQEWPSRPIRIISPFPAGGSAVLLGRAIGEKLTAAWGQNVVVESKPSAGGIVATQTVALAPADGYTILLSTANIAIAPSLYKKLPYDPDTALTPVTQIVTVPNVIVARLSLPVKTMKDVIQMVKAQPGKTTYASPGNGSFPHLIMERLKHETGMDILNVPYKGTPAALVALIGGEVDLLSSNLADVAGLIKAGKVRPIAVTSSQRFPTLPDVPTVAESGVPGFHAIGWMGFFAPRKTPPSVIDKLAQEIASSVKDPKMSQWLHEKGFEAIGSTPAEFDAFVKADTARWAQAVKFANLQPE